MSQPRDGNVFPRPLWENTFLEVDDSYQPNSPLLRGQETHRLVRNPELMNSPKLVVRRMAESELNLALEWAAAEGWNPGLYDAECFYAADPEGFFLGEFAGGKNASMSGRATYSGVNVRTIPRSQPPQLL